MTRHEGPVQEAGPLPSAEAALANDTVGNEELFELFNDSTDTTSTSWVDSFYASIVDPNSASVDAKGMTLLHDSPPVQSSSPTITASSDHQFQQTILPQKGLGQQADDDGDDDLNIALSQNSDPISEPLSAAASQSAMPPSSASFPPHRPSLTQVMAQREAKTATVSGGPSMVAASAATTGGASASAASTPSAPQNPSKSDEAVLKVLSDGIKQFTNRAQGGSVGRTEYLVAYVKSRGYHFRGRTIESKLNAIRHGEKGDDDLRALVLLTEPGRGKLRNIAPASQPASAPPSMMPRSAPVFESTAPLSSKNAPPTSYFPSQALPPQTASAGTVSTPLSPALNQQVVPPSGSAQALKVGFCREGDSFNYFADLSHIVHMNEDEHYIAGLCANDPSITNALDSVLPRGHVTHPLTYMRVPLNLRRSLSVDLDTDRMVSYAETIVSVYPERQEPGDYSNCVLLKAVTQVFVNGKILRRKTDPVTGFLVSANSPAVRVMLPLQAGIWAGLINDLHNGIVEEPIFDGLAITQTLLNTDATPVHSFVWDFTSKSVPSYVPKGVIISNRRHKRTRSRSLGEIDLAQMGPQSEPSQRVRSHSQLRGSFSGPSASSASSATGATGATADTATLQQHKHHQQSQHIPPPQARQPLQQAPRQRVSIAATAPAPLPLRRRVSQTTRYQSPATAVPIILPEGMSAPPHLKPSNRSNSQPMLKHTPSLQQQQMVPAFSAQLPPSSSAGSSPAPRKFNFKVPASADDAIDCFQLPSDYKFYYYTPDS